MQIYRYHFEVGFPTNLRRPIGMLRLTYGLHARQAALDDRYGPLPLPITIDLEAARLIEAEALDDGTMVKGLYRVSGRVSGTDGVDLVLAISFDRGYPFVKTIWGNRANDRHITLRRELYDRPEDHRFGGVQPLTRQREEDDQPLTRQRVD